jgi:DNA-binding SARP family transcriptional activator
LCDSHGGDGQGHVEFRILGPLEVALDGRLLELGRPKQRAVLAVLLVHANRTVSVEHLVDELWGDDPPAQAIGSLQAYVSHLRRLLEPARAARAPARVLVSQPPGYRVVVSPDDLDAARFEALATRGRRLLEVDEADRAGDALGRALGLWRGDVLADFPDAPFARAERARLDELRLGALEDRIAADLARRRHAAIVAELDQLVAAHPYRESLRGLQMLALYRCGRQAEALRAYHETRRLLSKELGIDPSPRLDSLHQQILGHAPELDEAPAMRTDPVEEVRAEPAGPAPDPERTLVGRAEHLNSLELALGAAVAGRGRLVLLAGEPGVGKTRLAEELARRANGVTVAWGRCDEEPGAPPFWPWTQVLNRLLAEIPADQRPALLAPYLPELGAILTEPTGAQVAPALPVVDVEVVRFRLCRAVTGLLRRLAADRPLLVVIDDAQWADVGSLRLLPVLAGDLGTTRILVVATYRNPDVPGEAAVAATQAALARLPTVDRITLGDLSRVDVRRLMAARLGADPDDRLVRTVHDRSAGNPFFVVELVRLLGSRRRLAAVERAAAGEVPVGVRDVLRRRLARLPEQTQAILLVAAVVGREFDLDAVRDVSGLDDEAALDAVEAALLSGMVVDDTTVGRFRFAHALVREAIYHEVSRVRRARLHARVAEALAGRSGMTDRAAVHWWLAAPVVGTRKVLPHLLAGADHARSILAHEEAEQHLRHALEVLAVEPQSTERTRSELDVHMRLGALFAQLHGAQSVAGRAAVTRARELAEELADSPATIAAYRSLYEVAVARAEHTEARELAERMLTVSQRLADPASLAQTHLAMGRTLWCLGEPATAREHLERSLDLARTAPDPPHEMLPVGIIARLQLAPVLDLLGHEDEAVVHVSTAITATRTMPALVRAGVFTSAALISALRRDVSAAGTHASQALDLAGPLPAWFSYASAVRSWARALEGDPAGGASALRHHLDEIQSRGARHLVAWVLGLLAEAETLSGHVEEALRLLDEALAQVSRTGECMYEAELHRLRGQTLLAGPTPRAGDAGAALRDAFAIARRHGAELLARRATQDLRRLNDTR